MGQILISLEEYMNIQDIDNNKAEGKASGMRLSHGSEDIASTYLEKGKMDEFTKTKANTDGNVAEVPATMAENVWRAKMTKLLDDFIGKYRE